MKFPLSPEAEFHELLFTSLFTPPEKNTTQIYHYLLDINMHPFYVYKYNNNMYTYNYMNISQWKDKELNE